ncbi:hypothetical protein [Aliivibrio fischeri]|nr:hypothetical protein [Aliivibrio fischeri]
MSNRRVINDGYQPKPKGQPSKPRAGYQPPRNESGNPAGTPPKKP